MIKRVYSDREILASITSVAEKRFARGVTNEEIRKWLRYLATDVWKNNPRIVGMIWYEFNCTAA